MPRRLLLMRHARPQPSGPGPDLARELSPEGWTQARLVGHALRGDAAPQVIFSSPATRCQQTAAGVVEGLAGEIAPMILIRAELGLDDPAGCVDELAELVGLAEQAGVGASILIVSHQPTILSLAAALLPASSGPVDLRPAAVALLEADADAWRLRRMLDPPPIHAPAR